MSKSTNPRLRFFQILILLLIAIICVYLFIYSPFFYVDKITVSGAEKVKEKDILRLSGLSKGVNIFKVDSRLVATSIEAHPIIKEAKVTRRFPREIKIDVVERKIWAVMPYQDIFLCLDSEGVCIDKMLYFPLGNYCLVTMDEPPVEVSLGQPVASSGIDMIRKISAALSEESNQNLSEFHYKSKSKEVIIYTLKGTEIRFGNLERLKEKAEIVNQIFAMEIELEENGTGLLDYVDIRFSGQPVLKMK